MRSACILLISFALFVACSPKNYRLAGKVKGGSFNAEIPFNYDEGMLIADVLVNGEVFTMAFDTGADYNVFDLSFQTAIDYKPTGALEIQTASSKVNGIERGTIKEIEIGGVEFKNTSALFMDLSGVNQVLGCPNIDGLIGNNIMRKAKWKIDYNNQTLTMASSFDAFSIPEDAYLIPLQGMNYGGANLPVTINNKSYSYKMDTGFRGEIKGYDIALSEDYPSVSRGLVSADASGRKRAQNYVALLDTFSIGSISLADRNISLTEGAVNIVGNAFFEHFTMYIDWETNVLVLAPEKEFEAKDLNLREVGLAPNFDNNSLEVASVYNEGKFETAIIGRKVVELEGMDTSSFSRDELCAFWGDWEYPTGDYELVLEDENGQRDKLLVERLAID